MYKYPFLTKEIFSRIMFLVGCLPKMLIFQELGMLWASSERMGGLFVSFFALKSYVLVSILCSLLFTFWNLAKKCLGKKCIDFRETFLFTWHNFFERIRLFKCIFKKSKVTNVKYFLKLRLISWTMCPLGLKMTDSTPLDSSRTKFV